MGYVFHITIGMPCRYYRDEQNTRTSMEMNKQVGQCLGEELSHLFLETPSCPPSPQREQLQKETWYRMRPVEEWTHFGVPLVAGCGIAALSALAPPVDNHSTPVVASLLVTQTSGQVMYSPSLLG